MTSHIRPTQLQCICEEPPTRTGDGLQLLLETTVDIIPVVGPRQREEDDISGRSGDLTLIAVRHFAPAYKRGP